MKPPPKAPKRYHLAFKGSGGWTEYQWSRARPEINRWKMPHRWTDVLTGETWTHNFTVADEAEFVLRPWPLLEKMRADMAAHQQALKEARAAREAQERQRRAKARERRKAQRLPRLQQLEKQWIRKLKYAQTRLKKIRAAIKRRAEQWAELCHWVCFDGRVRSEGMERRGEGAWSDWPTARAHLRMEHIATGEVKTNFDLADYAKFHSQRWPFLEQLRREYRRFQRERTGRTDVRKTRRQRAA